MARKTGVKDEFNGPSVGLMRKLSAGCEGMGTFEDIEEEIYVPTMLTSLNRCTGLGGWPLRRIGLVHGPKGKGKTVVAIAIAESLRRFGHVPTVFEPEHSAEKVWFNELACGSGVLFKMPEDMDEVINDMQDMLGRLRKMREGKGAEARDVKNRGYCFVIDTVTKLLPKEALDKMRKEGVQRGYSVAAMWLSLWMKSLVPQLYRLESVLIGVLQERQNQDRKGMFDPKHRVTCGDALPYDSSLQIRVGGIKSVKQGGEIVGSQHYYRTEKNKVDGVQRSEGSFFTSNGRGDCPIGYDLQREAIEEAKVRKFAVHEGNMVRLKVPGSDFINRRTNEYVPEYEFNLKGGWETLRRYYLLDDPEEFGRLVAALNEDSRRQ